MPYDPEDDNWRPDEEADADLDDDWNEDDESEVVRCPNCGADVYEDAEQCPHCGEYIVHTHSAWEDKPIWWILLGLAGIVAVVVLLAGL